MSGFLSPQPRALSLPEALPGETPSTVTGERLNTVPKRSRQMGQNCGIRILPQVKGHVSRN